jgi:hypothetical protein
LAMPAFSAGAALYQTSEWYTGVKHRDQQQNLALAQLWRRDDSCIEGCICFSPINCPCCVSIFPPYWPRRLPQLV